MGLRESGEETHLFGTGAGNQVSDRRLKFLKTFGSGTAPNPRAPEVGKGDLVAAGNEWGSALALAGEDKSVVLFACRAGLRGKGGGDRGVDCRWGRR